LLFFSCRLIARLRFDAFITIYFQLTPIGFDALGAAASLMREVALRYCSRRH